MKKATKSNSVTNATKSANGAGTMNFDVQVVSFKTRIALETFNKKANWNAVVKTVVPKGCAIYKHQTESQVTP